MFLVDYLVHIFQALGKPSLWYPEFMIIITFAFPVNRHKTERLEEILILQPILRSTRTHSRVFEPTNTCELREHSEDCISREHGSKSNMHYTALLARRRYWFACTQYLTLLSQGNCRR